MFRTEVTLQDAIVAITIIECSMQVHHILPSPSSNPPYRGVMHYYCPSHCVGLCHANAAFPVDADEEYGTQGTY